MKNGQEFYSLAEGVFLRKRLLIKILRTPLILFLSSKDPSVQILRIFGAQ